MGGIKSLFQFRSYKVDRLNLDTGRSLELLSWQQVPTELSWQMKLSIRRPLFFTKHSYYVGGVDCKILLLKGESEAEEVEADEQEEITPENAIVRLNIGIAGVFEVGEERFPEEIEKSLVKVQIPMILLPYLRAAASSILANGGFGSVVLPLINIQKVAEDHLTQLDVRIVD